MQPSRSLLIISILCLLSSYQLQSQSCIQCNEYPSITQFDFDVKVPQPNASDGTDQLWPEWKNLFMIANVVGSKLLAAGNGCIRIMIPPASDKGDQQTASVGGETFTNLPSNPLISSDLSVYGDYMMTGSITAEGANCKLHVEIQTSCSRKTVATADITFPLNTVAGNVSGIADQVVQQLSPLGEKIKEFQETERASNKSLSLYTMSPGEPMKIIAQKKQLKAGESTSFTIELKDCDGKPLEGREILFNESNFKGFRIYGTVGGTVSPSKLITDADGKATGTFTLKAGASEALISAHSPGKDVKGCESMFTGDAGINIKATYSGYIKYNLEMTNNCRKENTSGCLYTFNKWINKQSISFSTSFYTTQEKGSSLDIGLTNDESQADGSLVPDLLAHGTYSHNRNDLNKGVIVCESANKGDETLQRIIVNTEGGLDKAGIRISESGGFAAINLDLVFDTNTSSFVSQTALPTQNDNTKEKTDWNVAFDTIIEKDFSVRKTKSGNKTVYTLQGTRGNKLACGSTKEFILIVVYEE